MAETQSIQALLPAFRVQTRVIGALILRELHTRFGRENIGYLWFIVEPMMLASGVAVIHLVLRSPLPGGLEPGPFYVTGYVAYMLFRSNVIRATGIVISNKGLMYHRQVTLVDLVLSRTILELAATSCAMIILLGLAFGLGLGKLPARPLWMMAGMVMMFWFSTALAMIVCSASEISPIVERLIHPITYLVMPLSGMFFLIGWIPEPYRDLLAWAPLPQIIEMVRIGMFEHVTAQYVNLPYLVGWCLALTALGFLSLRVARRRLHFE